MSENPPILILVRDLMFASRIAATARAENAPIKAIKDPAQLGGEPGTRLIVDLNQAGAIEAAAHWKTTHGGEVIGFVSHVDTATIERAKAAGIDRVLPRSQFVQELAELLRN